jgi:hypothetical protein
MRVVVRTVDVNDPPVQAVDQEVRHTGTRIGCLPNAPVIAKTPASVANDDSPYELETPGEPTFAATPPSTRAQSLPDFCHVDNVASEPPHPPPRSPDSRYPHDRRTTVPRGPAPKSQAQPRQKAAAGATC